MLFKRAYDEGAGVVHAVVVNHVLLALKNTERHTAGARTMASRSVGAALILVSVVLAVKR